jgi:hypothetical protein
VLPTYHVFAAGAARRRVLAPDHASVRRVAAIVGIRAGELVPGVHTLRARANPVVKAVAAESIRVNAGCLSRAEEDRPVELQAQAASNQRVAAAHDQPCSN